MHDSYAPWPTRSHSARLPSSVTDRSRSASEHHRGKTRIRIRWKRCLTVPLLVMFVITVVVALGTSTSSRAGSRVRRGNVRVTARVLEVDCTKGAAAELSRAAHELAELVRTHGPLADHPHELGPWLEDLEREHSVGGATVQLRYLPPDPRQPAILQVEWTSN